jgi:hypothetical protein
MQKHNPPLTAKSASTGSATTPKVKALTPKEAGAAESFLWLLSFAEKESDALAAGDTREHSASYNKQHEPTRNNPTLRKHKNRSH